MNIRTYNYNESENLEPDFDEPASPKDNRNFWVVTCGALLLLGLFVWILKG